MTAIELVIIGAVSFLSSIMSAISSGGGGFIMTPLLILFGLTPAEAIATGKIGGLATTVGSLSGMKAKRTKDKKTLLILLLLGLLAGLISPLIIVNLDSDLYSKILGVFLIIVGPFIYFKKVGHVTKSVSRRHRTVGFALTFIALLLQGSFSTGMGIFVSIAIMSGLGLNALDANIGKRSIQLILNTTIVLTLFGSNLIVWPIAFLAICTNLSGSYIGGKIAARKGSTFVSLTLAILAFVSGIMLLVESW